MGTTLLEPALAVLGFFAVTGVVIALGATSTARFEFERNAVGRLQSPAAHRAGSHPAGRRSTGRSGAADSKDAGDAGDAGEARSHPQALGVAVRPAPTAGDGPGWWLVEASTHVVAGPFPDRIDADWAALAEGIAAVAVFGTRRPDGTVAPRSSAEERAWLAQLGEQLDRLPDDWNEVVSDTDPLTTLVVEIVAALVEAGLSLHDPAGGDPAGGVCLLPEPVSRGVLVSWRPNDRLSRRSVRGVEVGAGVQQLMNATLADVLAQQGFVVEPHGGTGCSLVTALR